MAIAAMMTGEQLGVGHEPRHGTAYVSSWIKELENDPREIRAAAVDAQRISDWLIARERERSLGDEWAEHEPPAGGAGRAPERGPEPAGVNRAAGGRRLAAGAGRGDAGPRTDAPDQQPGRRVRRFALVASAGTGAEVITERITDRVKFRRHRMRSHSLQGHQCRIVTVIGESMEPTLPDGASILVNMEQQEPRDRRTFVVQIEDEIVVKRLIRNPDAGWLLQSDNRNKRAWPTRPWPDEAKIVGQVKWLRRTFT